MACEEVVQADPAWQEAMRRRGVEDFSLAMVDPWAAGFTGPEDHPSERRIARPLTWVRSSPASTATHGRSRAWWSWSISTRWRSSRSTTSASWRSARPRQLRQRADGGPGQRAVVRGGRTDLKPISITQPEGASFTVTGHQVSWQKWSVRVGFTPREGLVLHELAYDGRPIIYRASLAEMFVPTATRADPPLQERLRPGRVRRRLARELAHARVRLRRRDLLLRRRRQRPGRRAGDDRQRDLHARGGLRDRLEAHRLPHRGRRGARLRRLVLSSIATVGNYEYGYFWYLYTDGTIEYEVKLTGVISTGALPVGRAPGARHAGRAGPVRAAPPALLLRAPGHGRRRQRQHASCRSTPSPALGRRTRTARRG